MPSTKTRKSCGLHLLKRVLMAYYLKWKYFCEKYAGVRFIIVTIVLADFKKKFLGSF